MTYAGLWQSCFKTTRSSRYQCVSPWPFHQSLRINRAQIKDNIAFGNPNHADDPDLIKEAARLGGADSVIKRLPEKWDTYIRRPDSVHDVIRVRHNDDDGAIDRALREMTGTQIPQGLSGGQEQRIAVYVHKVFLVGGTNTILHSAHARSCIRWGKTLPSAYCCLTSQALPLTPLQSMV